MALTFKVEGELTRAGLEAAREAIDGLLAELSDGRRVEESPDRRAIAQRKARDLKDGLGGPTRRFLRKCADNFEAGQEFTLNDIAELFDEPVGTVRAWHRAASKVINRVNREMPDPPVFHSEFRGSTARYWMDAEMRGAIIEQDV